MTTREHPHLATAAPWADEPLGRARRRQVLKACLLACEPLLELHDRAREVWPGHRRTVEPSPDGTGYAHAVFVVDLGIETRFGAQSPRPCRVAPGAGFRDEESSAVPIKLDARGALSDATVR